MSASLLNKTNLRQYLLDHAAKTRHHPFKRVSADTIAKLEGVLRKAAADHVNAQPSKGTTL